MAITGHPCGGPRQASMLYRRPQFASQPHSCGITPTAQYVYQESATKDNTRKQRRIHWDKGSITTLSDEQRVGGL